MSDTLNKDATDQALAEAVDTEEFTFDGVTTTVSYTHLTLPTKRIV